MTALFAIFKEYLVWSLFLWVLLFVAFTALFARGNLTALARGLGRVLASIIVSPMIFLRHATHSVMFFDATREESLRTSDQYVLNKTMMILQAGTIIFAIGMLAAGGVATWNVLVPPREVREAAREHRDVLEKQRADAATAVANVAKLDADWAAQQGTVLAKYRSDHQTSITDASKQMADVGKALLTYGNATVQNIFTSLQQRAGSGSYDSLREAEYAKNSLDGIVSSNWYWLDEWARGELNRWNALWMFKKRVEIELRDVTVSSLRSTAQPQYAAAVAGSTAAADNVQQATEVQARLDEEASLKWKAAMFRAGAIFAGFLLFVWMTALLIEGGWLAIRVAGDVRRLREATDAQAATRSAIL